MKLIIFLNHVGYFSKPLAYLIAIIIIMIIILKLMKKNNLRNFLIWAAFEQSKSSLRIMSRFNLLSLFWTCAIRYSLPKNRKYCLWSWKRIHYGFHLIKLTTNLVFNFQNWRWTEKPKQFVIDYDSITQITRVVRRE